MARILPPSTPTYTLRCGIAVPARLAGMQGSVRSGDNAQMQIQLNGQPRDIDADSTLVALLHAEGLAERKVAVEVNGEIVPRGLHASRILQAKDRVEIVHALGGG